MAIEWDRLTDVLQATACNKLAGPSGRDYTTESEDLAQDTIIKLLEKDITDNDIAFKLGVKIITELCINFIRDEINRRDIEEEFGDSINRNLTGQSAETLAADPYEILAYDEMRDRLDELSPLLYATVELHYMKGLDVSAVAELQNVTEDVIRKRLQRAREFVRDEAHEDKESRPSMEDIEQQVRDNFKARDTAYLNRKVRKEYPDATLTEWSTMYG